MPSGPRWVVSIRDGNPAMAASCSLATALGSIRAAEMASPWSAQDLVVTSAHEPEERRVGVGDDAVLVQRHHAIDGQLQRLDEVLTFATCESRSLWSWKVAKNPSPDRAARMLITTRRWLAAGGGDRELEPVSRPGLASLDDVAECLRRTA